LDEREVLFEAARKGLGSVFCMPMLSEENTLFQDGPDALVPLPIVDCHETGQVVLVTRTDNYFSKEAEAFQVELSRKFYRIEQCTQSVARTRLAS
jgi:hypothetical protein